MRASPFSETINGSALPNDVAILVASYSTNVSKLTNMKRFPIFFTFLLFSVVVFAQEKQDHDLVKDGNPVPGMSTPQEKRTTTPDVNEQNTTIRVKEIPTALKNILGEKEYNGWEQGQLYYNEATRRYSLQVDSERRYEFDEQGRRITTVVTPLVPVDSLSAKP